MERFDYQRAVWIKRGNKIFSLADAYEAADIVTYPSTFGGFGMRS